MANQNSALADPVAPGDVARKAEPWNLQLYIAGSSRSGRQALANLKSICESHLPGGYDLEVIDLREQPERVQGANVIVVPMLVRTYPEPTRRIVGDLSDTELVVASLDLEPISSER